MLCKESFVAVDHQYKLAYWQLFAQIFYSRIDQFIANPTELISTARWCIVFVIAEGLLSFLKLYGSLLYSTKETNLAHRQ